MVLKHVCVFGVSAQLFHGETARGVNLQIVPSGVLDRRRQQFVADLLSAEALIDLGVVDVKRSLALDFVRHFREALAFAANDECSAAAFLDVFNFHYLITSFRGNEAKCCHWCGSSIILNKMKIYDITVTINAATPIYKGDPGVELNSFKSIATGSSANVSQVSFGVHTATHVDAPNHFIDGAKRVHELDPQKLVGPCRVVAVPENVLAIEPEHVGDLTGVERILFKTQNSSFWATPELGFRTDFSYLTPATAKLLVASGIVLVGIDYLSIEKSGSPGHPVHITLLEKEVVILEGVDLREVAAGDYELICSPLKYDGATGDGSPARTFLREL